MKKQKEKLMEILVETPIKIIKMDNGKIFVHLESGKKLANEIIKLMKSR